MIVLRFPWQVRDKPTIRYWCESYSILSSDSLDVSYIVANEMKNVFSFFQILFPLYEFHMEFDFLYISYDQFYFFITQAITWHTAKADFESNNMSSHPWTCQTNAILLIIPLAFSPAALCIQLIRQAICWNWFACMKKLIWFAVSLIALFVGLIRLGNLPRANFANYKLTN